MPALIHVRSPKSYPHERRYICEVLLADFLGLDVTYETADVPYTEITIPSVGERRSLRFADQLFVTSESKWCTSESMPVVPLRRLTKDDGLGDYDLPLIYSDSKAAIVTHLDSNNISLSFDLFGSCFFMLSRYEEVCASEHDDHLRFKVESSLLYRENALDRPLVNEYLELLWMLLQRLWPLLVRKKRSFEIVPTHDVDRVYMHRNRSAYGLCRILAGDVALRKSPGRAIRRIGEWARSKANVELDPFWTFNWILEQVEAAGHRSIFHFIAGKSGRFDSDYVLTDPHITALIKRLRARGHTVGLHGSYDSYNQESQLKEEVQALASVCGKDTKDNSPLYARQHYLRWDQRTTPALLEAVGVDVDSTLGFAERAGFRTGCCYDYPLFDWGKGQGLKLRESPLIVMDGTLRAKKYMNLPEEGAHAKIQDLKQCVKAFNGTFNVLWHNDVFHVDETHRELFLAAIK